MEQKEEDPAVTARRREEEEYERFIEQVLWDRFWSKLYEGPLHYEVLGAEGLVPEDYNG